jgi:hypothetical protein
MLLGISTPRSGKERRSTPLPWPVCYVEEGSRVILLTVLTKICILSLCLSFPRLLRLMDVSQIKSKVNEPGAPRPAMAHGAPEFGQQQ